MLSLNGSTFYINYTLYYQILLPSADLELTAPAKHIDL